VEWSGKWRMESREWKVESGEWRVESEDKRERREREGMIERERHTELCEYIWSLGDETC
jgi:hypothetical protein